MMIVMVRGSEQQRKIHRFRRLCYVSTLDALMTLQRQLGFLLLLHLDVQDASLRPLTFMDGLELTPTATTSDFFSFLLSFWCLTPKGEKIRGSNYFRDLATLPVLSFESSLLVCERNSLKTLFYVLWLPYLTICFGYGHVLKISCFIVLFQFSVLSSLFSIYCVFLGTVYLLVS